MRFMATSSGSFLCEPPSAKKPAAVSLVDREAAVSHLTDTAAVGLPTANEQQLGFLKGFGASVVVQRTASWTVPLAGVSLCRPERMTPAQ
jgi:hypothetical protein